MDKPADTNTKDQEEKKDSDSSAKGDKATMPKAPTDTNLPTHTSEKQTIDGYGEEAPKESSKSEAPAMKVEKIEEETEKKAEPIKLNEDGEQENLKGKKPQTNASTGQENKKSSDEQSKANIPTQPKTNPIQNIGDEKAEPIPSTPPPNTSQSSVPLGFAGKNIPKPPPAEVKEEKSAPKKQEPSIKFDDDNEKTKTIDNTQAKTMGESQAPQTKTPADDKSPNLPGVGKPMGSAATPTSPPSIPMHDSTTPPPPSPGGSDSEALKNMSKTPPPPPTQASASDADIAKQGGGSNTPPPTPTPQTPITPKPQAQRPKEEKAKKPKKKGGKGKKIMMGVLGFILLLAGAAAGYYYYTTNVQTPEIAQVGDYCVRSDQCGRGEACDTSTNRCKGVTSSFCPDDYGAKCYASCEDRNYCVAWANIPNGCNPWVQDKCGSTNTGGGVGDFCNSNSCTGVAPNSQYPNGCTVYKYACDSTHVENGCQDELTGGPTYGTLSFSENCGSEQIDVDCGDGGSPEDFVTREYNESCGSSSTPTPTAVASPSPVTSPTSTPTSTPTPTPTPTVVCNSLGYAEARSNVEIGQQLGLICNGEASNGDALNYDFRYRVDSGAWRSLVADGFNSTLVVDQAGHYEVQCRVCLTGANSNICSPVWGSAQ